MLYGSVVDNEHQTANALACLRVVADILADRRTSPFVVLGALAHADLWCDIGGVWKEVVAAERESTDNLLPRDTPPPPGSIATERTQLLDHIDALWVQYASFLAAQAASMAAKDLATPAAARDTQQQLHHATTRPSHNRQQSMLLMLAVMESLRDPEALDVGTRAGVVAWEALVECYDVAVEDICCQLWLTALTALCDARGGGQRARWLAFALVRVPLLVRTLLPAGGSVAARHAVGQRIAHRLTTVLLAPVRYASAVVTSGASDGRGAVDLAVELRRALVRVRLLLPAGSGVEAGVVSMTSPLSAAAATVPSGGAVAVPSPLAQHEASATSPARSAAGGVAGGVAQCAAVVDHAAAVARVRTVFGHKNSAGATAAVTVVCQAVAQLLESDLFPCIVENLRTHGQLAVLRDALDGTVRALHTSTAPGTRLSVRLFNLCAVGRRWLAVKYSNGGTLALRPCCNGDKPSAAFVDRVLTTLVTTTDMAGIRSALETAAAEQPCVFGGCSAPFARGGGTVVDGCA